MKRWSWMAVALLASCAGDPRPAAPDRLKERANESFLKGEFSQAARLYEQLAAGRPSEAAWAQLQAGKCRNGAEDWEGAAASFKAALAAGPDEETRLQILYYRAISLAGRQRYKEALEDLAAIETSSSRGGALPEDEFRFRVGVTRMRSGDWAGGRRELERLLKDSPQSRLAADAADRLALRGLCIQIGRVPDEDDTKDLVAEARSKGFVTEIVKGKRDYFVVTGRFRSVADAQAELARVRGAFHDAFIVP